jgi:cytochrome c oxidase cbb3-type subunit III
MKKVITLFLSFFLSLNMFAQQAAEVAPTKCIYDNPFLYFAIALIVIFAIIIVVLANVLSALAKNEARNFEIKNTNISPILVFALLLFPSISFSQDATAAATVAVGSFYMGIPPMLFYLLAIVVFLELIIIFILLNGINSFFEKETSSIQIFVEKIENYFASGFTLKIPAEEEKELMTDHDYDGIKELDNGMPPWLKYMFIGTIAFGVFYIFDYHVFRSSMLQTAEYQKELSDASIQMEAYRKKSANSVDETNVKLLTDASELAEGKNIFKTNCSACHGQNGEGTVGPNLTDDYWVHGGDIKSIFKTIKYGVVEKGMKAWQADISPSQMALVSSYIKSLRGTNPANPKEKQGELYVEGSEIVKSDSLSISANDSLKTSSLK